MKMVKRINFNDMCKVRVYDEYKMDIKLINDDNLSFSSYRPSDECIEFSELVLDKNLNPILPEMDGLSNLYMEYFIKALLKNKEGYYLIVEKTKDGTYFSYYPISNIEKHQFDIRETKISIELKKGYKYGFENGRYIDLSKIECDDDIKMYFDILRFTLLNKLYGKEYMISKFTNIIYSNNMDYTNKLIEFKNHPHEIRANNTYDTIHISNKNKCICDDILYVNGTLVNMIQTDDHMLSIKINMGYDDLCITKEYAHYNDKATDKAVYMLEFEPDEEIREIMVNFLSGKQLEK